MAKLVLTVIGDDRPGLVAALTFLNWPFFVGPVNGIVVSLVFYVVLAKLFPARNK